MGNLFFIAKKNYFFDDKFKKESNFYIKYLIIFIIGMLIGSLIFTFLNDIFSNSQMNAWAWKCFYLILFIVSLVFGVFLKHKISLSKLQHFMESFESQKKSSKQISFFLKNLCSIIPLYLFFIYSCENWLPRFVNPENMQFLDYGMINIFLILIVTLFTFPLFNLIGNKKLNNFVSTLIIVISILAFAFEYSSSYSINFLKFFSFNYC